MIQYIYGFYFTFVRKEQSVGTKRFKPHIDKLFWIIFIPTSILLIALTAVSAFEPMALILTLLVDIFTLYFLSSPLFGYVELREETLFVKLGFLMKREIPYSRIRGVSRERKFYSDSMLSLKNSFEHINIKYNTFDLLTVSVVGNEELCEEIEMRRKS